MSSALTYTCDVCMKAEKAPQEGSVEKMGDFPKWISVHTTVRSSSAVPEDGVAEVCSYACGKTYVVNLVGKLDDGAVLSELTMTEFALRQRKH